MPDDGPAEARLKPFEVELSGRASKFPTCFLTAALPKKTQVATVWLMAGNLGTSERGRAVIPSAAPGVMMYVPCCVDMGRSRMTAPRRQRDTWTICSGRLCKEEAKCPGQTT